MLVLLIGIVELSKAYIYSPTDIRGYNSYKEVN